MFHIAIVSNKYLPVDGDEQYAITETSKGKQAKCGHKKYLDQVFDRGNY